jgi:hypothetical protein
VHKSKEDIVRGRNEILALIIEELYRTVQKNSGEIELVMYTPLSQSPIAPSPQL